MVTHLSPKLNSKISPDVSGYQGFSMPHHKKQLPDGNCISHADLPDKCEFAIIL